MSHPPPMHTVENSYYPLDLFVYVVLQRHSMKKMSRKHGLIQKTPSNFLKIRLLLSPVVRCLEAGHLFHLFHLHIDPVLDFLNP